ncbi:hypothetical protein J3458_001831 [Metarhizium acridum]|uniref:uncharacterized protein n=1 Tax=Metarhizium acridum TaxID=92637 RepID=UPI001C6CA8F2|nr:hypothetical protein J3458_001831 [Metarhizium acridum]
MRFGPRRPNIVKNSYFVQFILRGEGTVCYVDGESPIMAYEHRSPVDTAADIGKHISLELGGKNPNLIFEDVDMGKAAPLAAKAAFENSGQICLCGSRIYIQRSRHEEFLPGLVGYVKQKS